MSKDTWVASTFWPTGMPISPQDPAFDAGIAGSYSNSMFNVLKNSHTVFRNTRTILQPHQQWTRVTVSSHLHRYLFPVSPPIFVFFFFFFPPSLIGHPNGGEGKYITFCVRKWWIVGTGINCKLWGDAFCSLYQLVFRTESSVKCCWRVNELVHFSKIP